MISSGASGAPMVKGGRRDELMKLLGTLSEVQYILTTSKFLVNTRHTECRPSPPFASGRLERVGGDLMT